jgi:NADPH-dependent 2,4-dienoyl-CoA reductase/sulfur reductase-like enzyme
MHSVIVGGGAAGFTAAWTCRALYPGHPVTLIDSEAETGYYRTLLPRFMAGFLPEEKLFFPRSQNDPLLSVRPGLAAKSLDRKGRNLLLSNGETLSYDRLLLACGGDPHLPGVLESPPGRGIFTVRDLTTARCARRWLSDHRKIAVFGGSLVGVKTAVHLRQAGFEVSIVARRGHILLRALSPEAAGRIEAHLRKMGIRLFLDSPLEEIYTSRGAVSALKAGGARLECDTLFVAVGIVPQTSFLEGTGLLTEGRLVVSPELKTGDPRIFAAGDVAVIASGGKQVSPDTWPQAVAQGKRAAENLYRQAPVPHRDLARINVMELGGLPMVILGPPAAGAEVISHERTEEGIYRELFLVDGRPVGGALIGDISAAGALCALIRSGEKIVAGKEALVRPRRRAVIPFPEHPFRRKAAILPQSEVHL